MEGAGSGVRTLSCGPWSAPAWPPCSQTIDDRSAAGPAPYCATSEVRPCGRTLGKPHGSLPAPRRLSVALTLRFVLTWDITQLLMKLTSLRARVLG